MQRKKVGLALSGGVSRGPAHIGVLNVLAHEGIPIDFVAGVSAGSIIGAAYCSGLPLADMHALAHHIGWRHIARPVWPRRGFISFKKLERLIAELIGNRHFHEMPLPFIAVATDLWHSETVVLHEGLVARAVHASCAVPGFVEPVQVGDMLLGDGGVSCNLPGQQVRAMGADYVIGVDLMQPHLRRRGGPLRFGFLALETLIQRSGGGLNSADCLIQPNLAGFNSLMFGRAHYLIEAGERAARQQLHALRAALDLPVPVVDIPESIA
jgi:NTE family protein